MGEYEQISLVPDLGGEIEEEDRIRKREEENLVESLLFSLGRSVSVEEIATCLNMGKIRGEAGRASHQKAGRSLSDGESSQDL